MKKEQYLAEVGLVVADGGAALQPFRDLTEADLNARLEEMAKETGRALPRLRVEYRDQQKRDLLISEVLEKKVLDLLLSEATITDVPTDASAAGPAKEA